MLNKVYKQYANFLQFTATTETQTLYKIIHTIQQRQKVSHVYLLQSIQF